MNIKALFPVLIKKVETLIAPILPVLRLSKLNGEMEPKTMDMDLSIIISLVTLLLSLFLHFLDDSEDYEKAIDFLIRNNEERLLIPLCGIAAMIDKTHCYERKIYNEFCLQQPSVQQIILKKCGIYSRAKGFKCKRFLEKYFKRFKKHCKKSLQGFGTNLSMEYYTDTSLQEMKQFEKKIDTIKTSSTFIVLIANETEKMVQSKT